MTSAICCRTSDIFLVLFCAGYINRMRGYHSQKDKLPGWEKGEINSYFYVPIDRKLEMRKYTAIKQPMWGREFPIGWRDIDHDLPPTAFASKD